MRALDTFSVIMLHRLPVDGRKRLNGLCQIVKGEMDTDPFSEAVFVFINKRLDVLRLVYWDRTGFALWMKRLEKEKFRWPLRHDEDVVGLSSRELRWLLDGIDILRSRPHQTLQFTSL